MHTPSIVALAILGMFLFAVPGTAIPATTHDVTFVNNADQTIWVNLQGGPKGNCTGIIDANTHSEKTCTACSVCPGGLLCNVSNSTGTVTPPLLPRHDGG